MEASGLRRKDTTKGPPLRILSLDGGGVRGYSMLILLQELMHRTFVEIEGRAPKRHEIPKPCDHFDLIAGTGTGGLIALMLGRLRLDIETCKDLYVRLTKRVFETDKTIAGIPYRSTLFKAAKLEEAIRECVRDHTLYADEGNDDEDAPDAPSPTRDSLDVRMPGSAGPQRTFSNASRYSQIGTSPQRYSLGGFSRWGNPNTLLYDRRENRTKTAVTAVYRGQSRSGSTSLLRSYDSRKEPAPEFDCTIWQAGRATSAIGLAFKPIQIGQSVFHDDGVGKYNPAPQILDEAVCNEWPGREVGLFVSIGTGKRPSGTSSQQQLWWEGFVGPTIGEFAEARRRLMQKIEECEDIHHYVLKEHLARRGVNVENYYRLNVEVGVGEFGMNEWNRLADISTNTRMYLAKDKVQSMNLDAAAKLARIHRAKQRWERIARPDQQQPQDWSNFSKWGPFRPPVGAIAEVPPPSNPIAIELPAEDVALPPHQSQPPSINFSAPPPFHPPLPPRPPTADSGKFAVISSDEYPQPVQSHPDTLPHHPAPIGGTHIAPQSLPPPPPRRSNDQRRSGEEQRPGAGLPPPIPPKTPIPGASRPSPRLPYPDADGPPPMVNRGRKPEFRG
ncbi:FabD/lysophospholipase-like protein [Eremomyces bilateralis CBS 781.70]|uniref:FabD/lysophospholipase-like protein n=1 Tax=Eremomyces bilateralis CBS 781.70 TaxID=1392243 RepID=A0A6G1GEG1_9PEZI|nr:FabD/lysophospholipase-like protein [Eremomyces bilateralis CBS 781.70]KAF1816296.1 FabD/lysophospholipase-like protein [Eremomyces bilateralis CBS 781.70]